MTTHAVKEIARHTLAAYCVAWIIAILIAKDDPEFCQNVRLTYLWVDGLHAVGHGIDVPGSDTCS